MTTQPNVLFLMCDQQRFDTIASLGNDLIYTPNLDRLVRRGVTFTNGYSTCPVCVPARYTIRTGCEPLTTGYFSNSKSKNRDDLDKTVDQRCGKYLPQTMADLGYRTFGIGKSHTSPWNEELGFQTHLHSEELYADPQQRKADAFAAFIAREHPEFDFIETLMGERTEMYYMPQMSPLPAEITVEAWAADRATEQLQVEDNRPYFGMVSFIGPHPPCAPPIPFNRMYDPDRMTNPIKGDIAVDHLDEQIPWMNHIMWADDINDMQARALKSRYYGEITYIDQCIGRILDAVEARPDADNTVICFFSDHGDHLGDHHAWQKESFFEQSCHVPFLVSWPKKIPADTKINDLVCLTDLFGIATHAAGQIDTRDGIDILAMLNGKTQPREYLFGYYGEPGTLLFKIMVRDKTYKYIFCANGGGELLFNLKDDPNELKQIAEQEPKVVEQMRQAAVKALQQHPYGKAALDDDKLRSFPFEARPMQRINQFDRSRGVTGFPKRPQDLLKA